MINIGKELKYDKIALKDSFDAAKKDKEFEDFLDKIKVSDDVAMKYTTSLEESFNEYKNCLLCPGLNDCKNKMLGYAYLPKTVSSKIEFCYKPCKYKNKQDKDLAYLKNIKSFNMPLAYQEITWESVDKSIPSRKETIARVRDFITNPTTKGLYLNGSFGCGKTYIIIAAFNALAKKNIKSAIVFWPEYLRDLKASFDDNYDEKFEYVKRVPLLLIDDLGAEATTSWSRDEILCPILQYRMDNNLATFITSNLTIDELEHHLSQTKDGVEKVKAKRIIERIKYLTDEMVMISKNMRNN